MATAALIRILVIEDDVGQARLVQRTLERAGYSVDVARDGEAGLALYNREMYAVLIIDYHLPGLAGLDILHLLAARGVLPPTIMVTGHGDEAVAVEAMKLGAGDYIVKDVAGGHLALLPTVVERVFSQQRLVEQKRQADEALRQTLTELERRVEERTAALQGVNEQLQAEIVERERAELSLRQAHDELEHRVAARTADLQQVNAQLQAEITERKQLETELFKARRLESLGVLAGGIAHDFNNILTGIMGNISLAKRVANPHEKIFQWLTAAETASQRATALTQQLLTFAKGGAPVRQTARIVDLLKESAEFALRGANVRCTYAYSDNLWPVEVDHNQMHQVFHNVIRNAAQAMPQGGIIQVRLENLTVMAEHRLPLQAGRYLKIAIGDQGSGIPAEHLPRIFDPYFTTRERGRGLGLATAYSIVTRHEGYMTVESAVDVGSTFYIYLPAIHQAPATPVAREVQPLVGTGKILIMDDEAVIRNLLSDMLTSLGYEVESARDGAEAVTLYQRARASGQPFQTVILDLTIPGGMGGQEVISILRDMDPQVKAIVSSGYSHDPVMANFRQYGFSGVVSKPYTMQGLYAVLQSLMRSDEA